MCDLKKTKLIMMGKLLPVNIPWRGPEGPAVGPILNAKTIRLP